MLCIQVTIHQNMGYGLCVDREKPSHLRIVQSQRTIVYGELVAHAERTFILEGIAIGGDPFLVKSRMILEARQKTNESNGNENAAHSPIFL